MKDAGKNAKSRTARVAHASSPMRLTNSHSRTATAKPATFTTSNAAQVNGMPVSHTMARISSGSPGKKAMALGVACPASRGMTAG